MIIVIIIIINNNFPVTLKNPGWFLAGNTHDSCAGEAVFSLGWHSPRDDISIKILMVVQPKNH